MRIQTMSLVVLAFGAVAVAGCTGGPRQSSDSARVSISVTRDGFTPSVVSAKAGTPLTLIVTRTTDQTCATELVMKDYGIHRELPLGHPVEITFTPAHAGDVRFACGMDMISGTVRVE